MNYPSKLRKMSETPHHRDKRATQPVRAIVSKRSVSLMRLVRATVQTALINQRKIALSILANQEAQAANHEMRKYWTSCMDELCGIYALQNFLKFGCRRTQHCMISSAWRASPIVG
ncbi:hypothetical protein RRG08_019519 [Elysia crispata]|uniref:Uncharacterized protein n=1 Tax=Elysia crispata TaxID=231223 RepID=A0AAE0YYK6_9GAST|nr:hypothetical protein RRG08_019519 [Elysia crispata]